MNDGTETETEAQVDDVLIEMSISEIITLDPYDLNNGIYTRIYDIMKEKEKKCIKEGFVDKVVCLQRCEDLPMRAEDLESKSKHHVEAMCWVYAPFIGARLKATLNKITYSSLSAVLGPIQIIIPINRINQEVFRLSEKGLTTAADEKEVAVGRTVIVEVKAMRFNVGSTSIKVIGELTGILEQEPQEVTTAAAAAAAATATETVMDSEDDA
jgi:hypothetical protein